MAFEIEKRAATRLLDALENATLEPADARPLLEDADPALLYLVFGWLRARYGGGHSASEGVLGRIAAQCVASPKVARNARAGEGDPIVAWFEETHDYRELSRDEFVELIVEKLEG
jgi:hypothetical protein